MGKTMVYVSQWMVPGAPRENGRESGGGISIYELGEDGHSVTYKGWFPEPLRASCMTYVKETGTLYGVNQLKGKGRGDSKNASNLWAWRVDPETGMLTEIDRKRTMGGNPEAMTMIPGRNALVMCTTGGNDHVEKIGQNAEGKWDIYYEYDDGAMTLWQFNDDGTIDGVLDVALHREHGPDPSPSPQHGGRCQITGHPHSAMVDPTGSYVLSGDKGSDKIYVYRIHEKKLERVFDMWLGDCVGGRHIEFDPVKPNRLYMTTEYSAELFSFDLDMKTGILTQLDRISTVAPDFTARNEPATLRVHPSGKYVYVNNRGEDNIITVTVDENGKLTRKHAFQLSRFTGDPVNATRQFELSPDARYLFVAERPANLLHVLAVNDDGTLTDVESTPIVNPSSICFAQL
ncbi:MAG: lactonase family protein [Oscillospiraceae bacterium]